MASYIQTKDGTLVSSDKYLERTSEDGKEHIEDTRSNTEKVIDQLTYAESIKLKKFIKSPAAEAFVKAIGDDEAKQTGRREYLKGMVANELLAIQQENRSRQAEGKPLIPEEDRKLSIKDGVVISPWRAKEQAKAKKEAERTAVEMALDTLGYNNGK